jgi:hypothetical protein
MSNNDTIKAKRSQSRFLIIDELCINNLTIYEMAVYQQLRLLTDFSKTHDEVEITVKALAAASKISERQTYTVLNALEHKHYLIQRTNFAHARYGQKNTYTVARDYFYFNKEQIDQDFNTTAPHAVETAPHAVPTAPHAYLYKSHNSSQKSLHAGEQSSPQPAGNSSSKEITPVELVEIYHDVLPDNPRVLVNKATGEVERSVLKVIREFKKWWLGERGTPLVASSFTAYLEFMLETCPDFVLKEYTNKGGRKQKNSLTIFLHWETAAKLLADRLY